MADFLTTKGLSHQIEQLIIGAEKELYLITPFLQFSNQLYDRLKIASDKGIPITFVYGKENLRAQEKDKLYLLNCNIYYKHELHAKCFANEHTAIIGSMNLYAYSEANNWEMGIMLSSRRDKGAYRDCISEIKSLVTVADPLRVLPTKPVEAVKKELPRRKVVPKYPQAPSITQSFRPGFCIRTGVPIIFNPDYPLSPEAYQVWQQYGDPHYPEQFCHFSGEPTDGQNSYAKPILYKNWQRAMEHSDR